MSDITYRKPVDVPVVESVSENAMALVEDNGSLKRVAAGAIVGGGGIKTAIIQQDGYLDTIAGVQTTSAEAPVTFQCLNMTFEEAYETMAKGEPLMACVQLNFNNIPIVLSGIMAFGGTMIADFPALMVIVTTPSNDQIQLIWTAEGISTYESE